MSKQYTLIFILPFCVEMIIIQIKDNEYEIFDRLVKTIDLSEDISRKVLNKKNIFKILNIIYGYKNLIKENKVEDDIVFVTDGLENMENIEHLYGGINKIFCNSNEIIKSINKSHLIFLFFMDILKREKYEIGKILKLDNNILEEYMFKGESIYKAKNVKLYEERLDEILIHRDNSVKNILLGINRIIKMKGIDIQNDTENNIVVLNTKQNKHMRKFFKNGYVDKYKIQKLLKTIGGLKIYQLKSEYNMTDLEVYKFLKILAIIDKIVQDNNKVLLREFNPSSYFTKIFVMKKAPLKMDEYYKFIYKKFLLQNSLEGEYIDYIEKVLEKFLSKKQRSKTEFVRKFVLMKIAVIAIVEDISKDEIFNLDLSQDDLGEIIEKFDKLKLENFLTKREYYNLDKKKNVEDMDRLFCVIYFLSIMKKNNIDICTKTVDNHFKFKIKKKKMSVFEKEIFIMLKDYLCDYEDEDIRISFNLGG